jgi:uridine kinase
MRKLRTFLDRYSLEQNYISFIRPLMEYADVIWDNKKQNLINNLENICMFFIGNRF